MMFLAGVAGLNLPNVVVRFLPEAGRLTARLVAASYVITAAIAAVAATIFVAGAPAWAPRLDFVSSSTPLAVGVVVAAVAGTGVVLPDGGLTRLRRAVVGP